MEYRSLGHTGLRVSVLGFGCGAIGGLLVRGEGDEQRRAVARALEASINYFDTAVAYGDGKSEEVLGGILRELRAEPYVGTKFRVELSGGADIPEQIRRSLEGSLRRLGMERVDLFQLHNRIGSDPSGEREALPVDVVLGPVAEGLAAVREAGLTRFIGITGMGDTAALHQVIDSGVYDTAQCYVNALNPSAGWLVERDGAQNFDGLVGKAAAANVGVIAIRVLAAGALALQEQRHPNAGDPGSPLVRGSGYAEDLQRARDLDALARELGMEGAAELSYRLVLSHPGVSTALVGASDVSQLEDALRRVERGPLEPATLERVVALAAG
ncbi:MAG: aldo/keto reductase [Chloroflexota bacterium]|nr:aldo/keto reductase [Chloroflexota bacterium]